MSETYRHDPDRATHRPWLRHVGEIEVLEAGDETVAEADAVTEGA